MNDDDKVYSVRLTALRLPALGSLEHVLVPFLKRSLFEECEHSCRVMLDLLGKRNPLLYCYVGFIATSTGDSARTCDSTSSSLSIVVLDSWFARRQ